MVEAAVVALGSFTVGVVLARWATKRLLAGLVGLATALRLSAFVLGPVLSGLEVENIAVGMAAGARQVAPVALGTVYGARSFWSVWPSAWARRAPSGS